MGREQKWREKNQQDGWQPFTKNHIYLEGPSRPCQQVWVLIWRQWWMFWGLSVSDKDHHNRCVYNWLVKRTRVEEWRPFMSYSVFQVSFASCLKGGSVTMQVESREQIYRKLRRQYWQDLIIERLWKLMEREESMILFRLLGWVNRWQVVLSGKMGIQK